MHSFLLVAAIIMIVPILMTLAGVEMSRRRAWGKRAIRGAFLSFGLLATSVLIMASAVAWGPHSCGLVFIKVFGCAIGNYENLSGGLLAADAAIFAGWLAWSAVQLQIQEEERRSRASLAAQLDLSLLSATWHPEGRQPKAPAITNSPSLQVLNFGNHPAMPARVTFTLESQLPDFGTSTGKVEPTLPPTKQFHVGKAWGSFSVKHFYQTMDVSSLKLERQVAGIDVADFIPRDETRRIALPTTICNELLVYALYKDLFTRGAVSGPEGQELPKRIEPPVVVAHIDWHQIDGQLCQLIAKWVVSSSRAIVTMQSGGQEIDLSTEDQWPLDIDPEWETVRCELTLKRRS